MPDSTPTQTAPYKRVLLKLSGEALREPGSEDNISPEIVSRIAKQIAQVKDLGIEVSLVIGGGNFWRGEAASARGMERAAADYMGMLATVMNALAMQSALESQGIRCVVHSAIEMKNVAEPFIRKKAQSQLRKGHIVIFAAGTGNPFFSTDTTAALRANEMGVDAIFKATSVDGIYCSDPRTNPNAEKFDTISYQTCLEKRLQVMDSTAFSLCMDNNMPIIIFDMNKDNSIIEAISNGDWGTIVSQEA